MIHCVEKVAAADPVVAAALAFVVVDALIGLPRRLLLLLFLLLSSFPFPSSSSSSSSAASPAPPSAYPPPFTSSSATFDFFYSSVSSSSPPMTSAPFSCRSYHSACFILSFLCFFSSSAPLSSPFALPSPRPPPLTSSPLTHPLFLIIFFAVIILTAGPVAAAFWLMLPARTRKRRTSYPNLILPWLHQLHSIVITLPDAWRHEVSGRTGWPAVSLLKLDGITSLICDLYHTVTVSRLFLGRTVLEDAVCRLLSCRTTKRRKHISVVRSIIKWVSQDCFNHPGVCLVFCFCCCSVFCFVVFGFFSLLCLVLSLFLISFSFALLRFLTLYLTRILPRGKNTSSRGVHYHN